MTLGGMPRNAARPAVGSWLSNWLERRRRHPDEFVCGVRVIDGVLEGESSRWRFRRSAVDPYQPGGVVTLDRGSGSTIRLRMDAEFPMDAASPRPVHRVLAALAIDSGARLWLSVPGDDVWRFGL